MIVQFVVSGSYQAVCVTPFHTKEVCSQQRLLQHRVQLPQWCSSDLFEVLKSYLEDKLSNRTQINVERPHQLLQLAEHLSMDKFAEVVIKKFIMPSISPENCLLYLTESYRKLNSKEDESQVSWYQMLNLSMNTAARSLELLYSQQQERLNGIQQKIMNEIIERSFKFRKAASDRQAIISIMKSLRIYQGQSLVELLAQRRRMITQKRVYHENSANIIKTINLKNQKSEKQTSSFTLNDFTWKLITRRQGDQLQIYLKILDRVAPEQPHEIASVYFHSKVQKQSSERHYSKANLIVGLAAEVQVTVFSIAPFRSLQKERIEFSMFISIDYTSSALLNHIAQASSRYLTQELLPTFLPEDAKTLLLRLQLTETDKAVLQLLLDYIADKPESVVAAMDIGTFLDSKTLDRRELAQLIKSRGQKLPQSVRSLVESRCKSRQRPALNLLGQNRQLYNMLPLNISSSNRPQSRCQPAPSTSKKFYSSRTNKQHTDVMQRIDIRHFIRSSRPDMVAEFKSMRLED